jgi:EmrB/QacA subfamily drug resistance transporter
MTNSPAGDQQPISDRQKWQAFAVCVAVAAFTIIDISKVNLGLPSIERSLGAGPSQLQLIVAGYALAYGLGLAPSGRLGDIHSRKTMFLIGLGGFTAASVVCALAPNITVLLVARIAQGLAAGVQMPQVLGLIQQLFQGEARSRAFGIFGGAVGIGTATGPVIGGALVFLGGEDFGWRLLFWFNVPLGIVAMILAWRLVPTRQRRERDRLNLDLFGVLLLGLTVLTLMLPFVLTTGGPSDDPRRWFLLLATAALLPSFILWEREYRRRGKTPLLQFALFRLDSYRNGLLVVSAYYAALPSAFLLVALFLQQGLGINPLIAGLATLPYTLAQAVTAFFGGRYIHLHGRRMIVTGISIVMLGFVLNLIFVLSLPAELQLWFIAGAMAISGAGSGFVVSPNQASTLQDVPVAQAGVAGSLSQVGQRIGNSIGFAAVISTFYSTIYRETGTIEEFATYVDGFRNALLVVLGLFGLALVAAIIDLGGHRKRLRSALTE